MADGLNQILDRDTNAAWVRQTLRRARDEFARLLLEEVGHSLATTSLQAVEDELSSLNC